jgi:glycosyltransferase involved in cell wall biosynthesis
MAVADVLLVNERSTIVDMALPSKLTSYFVAGRPVLAAVTDEGTTAQEIRRANGGLVVPPENPDALIDGALMLTSDVELASRLATNAASYARTELSPDRVLREAETFVAALLIGK